MDLSRANNGHVSSPVCAVKPNDSTESPYTERKVNKRQGIFSYSRLRDRCTLHANSVVPQLVSLKRMSTPPLQSKLYIVQLQLIPENMVLVTVKLYFTWTGSH